MNKLRTLLVIAVLAAFACTAPLANAQRRGSFGGGGHFGGFGGGSHSFGGGSFGSRGGGSFGGGSSFGSRGGSFGGGSSFGRHSSGSFGSHSSSGSSFSRSGSFGSSGYVHSTTVRPSYSYSRPVTIVNRTYWGGGYYPAYYYGGWSDYSFYWMHPAWYYWMPFHPAFFYGPPQVYNGVMYPGDFSWGRLLIAILIFVFIIWLLAKLFGGRSGGGRKLKYTSYE